MPTMPTSTNIKCYVDDRRLQHPPFISSSAIPTTISYSIYRCAEVNFPPPPPHLGDKTSSTTTTIPTDYFCNRPQIIDS